MEVDPFAIPEGLEAFLERAERELDELLEGSEQAPEQPEAGPSRLRDSILAGDGQHAPPGDEVSTILPTPGSSEEAKLIIRLRKDGLSIADNAVRLNTTFPALCVRISELSNHPPPKLARKKPKPAPHPTPKPVTIAPVLSAPSSTERLWEVHHDMLLRSLKKESRSTEEIAERMARTEADVTARWTAMELLWIASGQFQPSLVRHRNVAPPPSPISAPRPRPSSTSSQRVSTGPVPSPTLSEAPPSPPPAKRRRVVSPGSSNNTSHVSCFTPPFHSRRTAPTLDQPSCATPQHKSEVSEFDHSSPLLPIRLDAPSPYPPRPSDIDPFAGYPVKAMKEFLRRWEEE